MVPHEFLPKLDLLVQQRHLRGGVAAVALGLRQQRLGGGELLGDSVAFLLQGGLVGGLAPNRAANKHRQAEQACPDLPVTTTSSAQSLRGC